MNEMEKGNCKVCGRETRGYWRVNDGEKHYLCGDCLELAHSYGLEPEQAIEKAKRDIKNKKGALAAMIANDIKKMEEGNEN